MLRSVNYRRFGTALITDVSAQRVGPIFKGLAIREELFLDIWLLEF